MSASCSCYHYTLGHFDISPLWYPAPLMSRFKCPLDVPTTTVPLGRKKLRKGTLMYSLILLPAYYGTFPTILLCKNRLCACKTIACSLDLPLNAALHTLMQKQALLLQIGPPPSPAASTGLHLQVGLM
jgi:hypothetical protein